MKTIGIIVVILLIGAVLVLGYMGFVPGLSELIGSTKPKDLGVRYTSADLASLNAKTGVTYTSLPSSTPAAQSEVVSGSKPLQAAVTQEELTAMVNDHSGKWKAYPVSDAQVKINNDGSMEMAGTLRVDRMDNYVAATGATGEQVQEILSTAKTLGANPSFYGKWDLQVVNGEVTGDIEKLTIGNVDIPQSQLDEYKPLLFDAIEVRLNQLNIDASSISVTNGKLNFNGSVPTQVALAP
jgi:hypothetical protein